MILEKARKDTVCSQCGKEIPDSSVVWVWWTPKRYLKRTTCSRECYEKKYLKGLRKRR